MRRLALWLSIPSLLMVTLWAMTAPFNNPPLSQADLQLHAAIAGADRMEIRYFSCQQRDCSKNILETETFNRNQLALFREDFRFPDALSPSSSGFPLHFDLFFYRGPKQLMQLNLSVGHFTTATGLDKWRGAHRLNPRFEAKLRAKLPLSRVDYDPAFITP